MTLRLILIFVSAISSAVLGALLVIFAPAELVDYGLIAIAIAWQVFFEWMSWNRRPKYRLLRIAFKAATVLVFSWWLYPFDQPLR